MSADQAAATSPFSSHRFDEAVEYLAPDVRWVTVGGSVTDGRDAVVAACTDTSAELADTNVEFTRFVVAARDGVVAVDAIGRYVAGADVSVVSSCDVDEFDGDAITTITTYAVELPVEPS